MGTNWANIPAYNPSWRVMKTLLDMDKCEIGIRSGFDPDRNVNAALYKDIFDRVSLAIRLRHLGVPFSISLMVGIIINQESRSQDRTFEFFFEDDPRSGSLIRPVHAILHTVIESHVSKESEYRDPEGLQGRLDRTVTDFINISSLWDVVHLGWFSGEGPVPQGAPEGANGRQVVLDKWALPGDVLFFRMIADCYITTADHWTQLIKEKPKSPPLDGVCPTCISSSVLPEASHKIMMPHHQTAIVQSMESFRSGLMAIVDTVVYIEQARTSSQDTESEELMDKLTDALLRQILSRDALNALYKHHPLKALEAQLRQCEIFTESLIECLKSLALEKAREFLNSQLRHRRIRRYTLLPDTSSERARENGLLWLTHLRRGCQGGQRPKLGTHACLGEVDDAAFGIRILDEVERAIYGLQRT